MNGAGTAHLARPAPASAHPSALHVVSVSLTEPPTAAAPQKNTNDDTRRSRDCALRNSLQRQLSTVDDAADTLRRARASSHAFRIKVSGGALACGVMLFAAAQLFTALHLQGVVDRSVPPPAVYGAASQLGQSLMLLALQPSDKSAPGPHTVHLPSQIVRC